LSTTPKHIVITGPTAGIGRAAALSLASQGAQLTLLCRNLDKGLALSEAIEREGGLKPHLVQMDMASLQSVRTAAASVLDLGLPIDVLLNNAGLINSHRRETPDGFEETLAVNHFAPFLLTGPVAASHPPSRTRRADRQRGVGCAQFREKHGI